jgi:3-oxoacyl-[acyl-carrier-protein] synthase II
MVEGLHRVVITGLGAVTPIGNTVQDYWNGLTSGRNGVDGITLFDASNHACRFAAEVKAFDPAGLIEPKDAKRWDRFCKFGVVASKQAIAHAGLEITDANAHRIGMIIGSGVGGLLTMETQAHVLDGKGPGRVSPFTVPMMIPNMASGLAAIALGTKGPSSAVATACAAGSNAIGDAFRLLQLGKADAMVCGGAESAITPLGVAGFASAKALSFRNDDPTTASRPFDKERDGFVIGEGAGILVLETLEHAQARGANVLGEVIGYGMTCDAHHITSPTPGGVGGAEGHALGHGRCRHHCRRGGLRECPRHQHPRQRQERNLGDQKRPRIACPADTGELDEIDDRPPSGWIRWYRSRRLRASSAARNRPTDDQSQQSRSRL